MSRRFNTFLKTTKKISSLLTDKGLSAKASAKTRSTTKRLLVKIPKWQPMCCRSTLYNHIDRCTVEDLAVLASRQNHLFSVRRKARTSYESWKSIGNDFELALRSLCRKQTSVARCSDVAPKSN